MAEFSIRPARRQDARRIAELYRIASEGVSDYVWQSLAADGEALLDVGERRYARDDSVFSYRSTAIVEAGAEIVAMLVAFPMEIDEQAAEPDPVLAPYSRLEEPDSYYICAMAVFDRFRNQGIGRMLLARAEEDARRAGISKLSLIVFEQNSGAKRLYERHGFSEVRRETIVPHPLLHCDGDALLMVKAL